MSGSRPFAVLTLLALGAATAHAQSYTWRPACATPAVYVTSRQVNFPGENSLVPQAIGFSFPWWGASASTVWLSSNGWLAFSNPGLDSYFQSQPIPRPAPPNDILAWYWTDLVPSPGGARVGSTASGAFRISTRANEKSSGALVDVSLELHPSGAIRMFFETLPVAAIGEVGLEDSTGNRGLELWQAGPVPGGPALLATGTAIEVIPDPRLTAGTPGGCGMNATVAPGTADLIQSYPWVAGSFLGQEAAVGLTLAEPSRLTATISGFAPRSLSLWLLEGDPGDDLEPLLGPGVALTLPVAQPGPHTLLVDGPSSADLGPTSGGFNLQTTCTPLPRLACGDLLSASTSGPTRVNQWDCSAFTEQGPETFYQITVPDGGRLDLALTSAVNHDLVVFPASDFRLGCSSCRTWGEDGASVTGIRPGETLIVGIEGRTGTDSGPFDLSAICSKNLDCGSATPIDPGLGGVITGTTAGGPSVGDTYTCALDLLGRDGPYTASGLTGPERVYSFRVPAGRVAAFRFESSNPDLVPLILEGCNEGRCRAPASCAEGLPAGDYYLVIDGKNGAAGAFTLTPLLLPFANYNRWTSCTECCDAQCTQFLDPTSWLERTSWRFSSGNHCGTGCSFAMFAVVDCGTDLHLPLYDANSFKVRIYDALRGRYVSLTATNDLPLNPPTVERFTLTGTEVSWTDRGCTSPPPCPADNCASTPSCGGGADPATRNAIIDIHLSDPESACGVFLVEFDDMGGSVWDLYNNCTADRTQTWPVYRDVCSAMEAWDPRAELVIEDVRADSTTCPDPGFRFTLRNLGCATASDFKVLLRSDGGEPDVEVPVASLEPFASVGLSAVFPVSGPSRTVTLTVDAVPASGVVAECSEATGLKGCGSVGGTRSDAKLVCSPCSVTASAGANATICETDAAPLDAGSSQLGTCTTFLLYRWEEVGNPGNFRDYSPDPGWPGQFPAADTRYRVLVQCSATPACNDSDMVDIFVRPRSIPDRVGNTLEAVKSGVTDIEWTWLAPAAGNPPEGYRLWRDAARDVPAGSRSLVAAVPAFPTRAADPGGIGAAGSPLYYQVVALSCGAAPLEGPY